MQIFQSMVTVFELTAFEREYEWGRIVGCAAFIRLVQHLNASSLNDSN